MRARASPSASAVERGPQRPNKLLFQSFRLMIRVKRTREPTPIVDLRWRILLACYIFTEVKPFSGMLRKTGIR